MPVNSQMERSQSCASFDASNNNNSSSSNNNLLNTSNNNNSSSTNSLNLRQALEMHHMQMQQQQQQHSGSSDSLRHLNSAANNTTNCVPLFPPMHRSQLHRQNSFNSASSTTNSFSTHPITRNDDEDDGDFNDDIDYQNNHEESAAHNLSHDQQLQLELELEHVNMLPYQKHLQFKQHKPNSESMLISCTERSRRLKHDESFDSLATTGDMSPVSPRRQRCGILLRDNSVHSDSSRYSSVDSLLEARKPNPEAILINLGFGPVGSEDILSRIPKRFLKPSQVHGIDTEAFVKRIQLAHNLADHSVLGYRGLTGNPDAPPSSIVAKIMQRFEVNERKKSMGTIEQTI